VKRWTEHVIVIFILHTTHITNTQRDN